MLIPRNSFIMVADGRKLLFFRNDGDANDPRLEVITATEKENPRDRDQKSDAPGRAFSSVGQGRSAYSEVDFHDLEESRFAAEAADLLRKHALTGDFERLIVIAPPKTLGELRRHYHKEVANRLTAEIPKDLTGHPVPEIERLLVEMV